MKKHTVDAKQLRRILISLTLLIAAVITLDSLPLPDSVPDDTTAVDVMAGTQPPETTALPTGDTDSVSTAPVTSPPDTTSETVTEPPKEEPGITVTILGSCAPGSPMGTTAYGSLNAARNGEGAAYFLENLQPILSRDDLTLAANACIFTDSVSAAYSCAASAAGADIYADGSVEMAVLSAPMFTGDALTDTKNALTERDILAPEPGTLHYLEKDGIRLAIYITSVSKLGDNTADIAAVRQAKEDADYVLVYYWGVDTQSPVPEEWLKYDLRQFADAGASLIVGSGCNVLRPTEVYRNTTIVYSLGALINGMSFGTDNASALLTLRLTPAEAGAPAASVELIPCRTAENRWQPAVMPDGEDKAEVNAFLTGSGELPLVNQ